MRSGIYFLLIVFLFFSCQTGKEQVYYEEINGFPNDEVGIEQGVSACFAGILNDYLLMAGGCNFPEVAAADGGTKRYYKGIYAARLSKDNSFNWKKVGDLPEEVAYGVTIPLSDRFLLVGGNNLRTSFNTVYVVEWADQSHTAVNVKSITTLPFPLDNMTGCLIGKYVYIAGGNKDGKPCNDVIRLSLQEIDKGWEYLPPFPGQARIQPICGGIKNEFYLWGGFDLNTKELDINGYRFDEKWKQWESVDGPTDMRQEPLFTGGGIASERDSRHLVVIGGVHKDVFMTGMQQTDSIYMRYPIPWYRFNPYVLQFDGKRWEVLSDSQGITARAGAALVHKGKTFYLVGGELKPGIRSNKIYRIRIE